MNAYDFITQNALNYTNMSDLIFYSTIAVGTLATIGGILYDLLKGRRDFRQAEVEANRHNHTVKR